MLTYSFTNIGSDSLYHHLYQCIREDILCGNLTAETKLPSKRSFAKNLGVSNITVENAYAQLQAEGYIYSIPKKGFYVRNLSDLTLSISQTTSSTSNSLRMPDKYKVDLASNQMNPEQFPFSVWSKLIRETLLNRHVELMQTPPWGGVWDLRHAICTQLKDFRGMDVTPEQIIIGAGTEYLYGLLIQLFGQDKVYAVENPGYHKIAKIYENSRVKYCYIPISAKGIDALELESSGAQIVHLSPSHHFPTGIVTPIGTRYELLAWATRQPGRYIIEDDYDSESNFTLNPLPALKASDRSGRVVYVSSLSKALSPGLRLGFMVADPDLIDEARALRRLVYRHPPTNIQYQMAHFLAQGHYETHLRRYHYDSAQRWERLHAALQRYLPSCRALAGSEHANAFWLQTPAQINTQQLTWRAAHAGVLIEPGARHFLSAAPPDNYFRMGFHAINPDAIAQGVEVLRGQLEQMG